MKLAVAQFCPIVGPVEGNLTRHLKLVELALALGVELVIFPELSLTGYEPALAQELSCTVNDHRLDALQSFCDRKEVAVGVGLPISGEPLPFLSHLLFRPHHEPQVTSKRFLHTDEKPFFQPGSESSVLIWEAPAIALAICYELSMTEHAWAAREASAKVYVASVAKTADGLEQAGERLSRIGIELSVPVLMSNCLGFLDGVECVGGSAAWNAQGELLAELDAESEGVIVLDLSSGEVSTRLL